MSEVSFNNIEPNGAEWARGLFHSVAPGLNVRIAFVGCLLGGARCDGAG